MNNRQDDNQGDGFGSMSARSDGDGNDEKPSDAKGDNADAAESGGVDRGRRRRARNKERAGEGSGVTLEGLITFFTYGSGILLLLIIGYFIYIQTNSSSGSDVEVQSNATDSSDRDRKSISVKTSDGTSIESLEEDDPQLDLTSETDRNEMLNKLDRFVRETRQLNSFRSEHEKHLKSIQKQIQILIKHIGTVSDSGNADPDLKHQADQASKQADQLIKKLVNAYDGNQQVKEKINELNYNVLWEVQDQRDNITGDTR